MKFFNLLKKELSELFTAQTVISLVIILVMFFFMGNVMKTTVKKVGELNYTVTISDQDKTEFTKDLIEKIREKGGKVELVDSEGDDYAAILSDSGKDAVLIIPPGFTESLDKGEAPEIISVAEMTSAAALDNLTNDNTSAVRFVNSCVSDVFAKRAGVTESELELIGEPVTMTDITVVNGKSAAIAKEAIMNQMSVQNMLIPIVVFALIIMTSQTLMSAISNEKIDKTLETLLSAPVSRMSILSSKMLAAAIIALVQAATFMVGSVFMVSGASNVNNMNLNTMTSESAAASIPIADSAILAEFGLKLTAGDYCMISVQLFVTIMICLSISLILGALVNDPKQSQTMITPLMIATLIPYMISMFTDINSLPTAAKLVVYAIPFTHTFTAIPNIMFGRTHMLWIGLAYQTVVFVICMFFAVRLFKSDKILTVSLNFGQKSKYKKTMHNA